MSENLDLYKAAVSPPIFFFQIFEIPNHSLFRMYINKCTGGAIRVLRANSYRGQMDGQINL